ncbi:LAGLIDADG family homing endonuclease [Pyrobaculum aerophilum]|uniref:Ribonucleoside-diphosphate reductase n=1 Tax=Pyrobaculum aerophilum TaxID=13773 RepID=A0A371R2Q1_9CREN|nr:LAGLIDADG family homing endonuclease [Pyrobaculum aerophilum]RFA98035.1 ribonucleoside-diphosphate reductase [Pyrobaculum aerophilum]
MPTVIKLDGRREPFSHDKLKLSVIRAGLDVGVEVNGAVEVSVNRDVGTWELADMVQLELLRRAIDKPELALVAKAHLLGRIYKETFGKDFLKTKTGYRERAIARFKSLIEAGLLKPEAIEALSAFEPRPDFDRSLSYNALRLFTNGNYALRDQNFRLAETPSMAAWRVATAVARELERAKLYYDYITQLKIVPASPFWFNAWTRKEMFASCFTLEVEDCLSSITHPGRYCIYDALAYSGIIQQLGGGVGYDFSLLRPEGDVVRGSVGVASGPVSFMRLFDANVDVIKQGGKRRGAQMGTLHVWHPDIRKFIKAKTGELKDAHLQNFNISVFVDDTFMEKALGVDGDPKYKLINPRVFYDKTGKKAVEFVDVHKEAQVPKEAVWGEVDARQLFGEIAHGAWDSGDPGLIFKSNLNASNPLLGEEIEISNYRFTYIWRSVNPCVTGDTRVLTTEGYLKISEVYRRAKERGEVFLISEGVEKDGDPRGYATYVVVPLLRIRTDGRTEQVPLPVKSGVLKVGSKDVYRVITKEGFEIKATGDHKLLVVNAIGEYEWRRVDELKPGDRLVVSIVDVSGADVGKDTMPASVAYLLGRVIGDGSIVVDKYNRPRIYVYFGKEELEEALALVDMLKTEFGSDISYSLHEKRTEIALEIFGTVARAIASMVPELIHMRRDKPIPEIIFESKPSIVKWFLRGLFDADGTIDGDHAIRLTSASRRLLQDVQQLLLLFGIYSVIYTRRRKGGVFKYVTKSGEERIYKGSETYYELVIKNESRCRFIEKIGLSPRKVAKISLKKCKREKAYATVVNVEYIGREVVYDFGVPDYHRYIAEGIVSHNCAETVQNPFEVCNLTHINLVKFVKENCAGGSFEEKLGCIDWEGLAQAARVGTRYLDDAIERSRTGIKIIDEMNSATRKNGLGIMGFAELLIKLGIPYASWEAVELINRIMGWIYVNALDESAELARERGPFKFFEKSVYARGEIPVLKFQDFVWRRWERIKRVYPKELQEAGDRLRDITMRTREWLRPYLERLADKVRGGVRNSVVLSIAPTGRTSILAGTTSGVEPVFALAFLRNVTVGTLIEYYEPGIEWLKARGYWTPQVRKVVEETGMLRDAPVPDAAKHLLATAMEIGWLWHVLMQASAQQWVDQGISKTINMPANAPQEDVYWAFAFAWAVGVKGITVYRDKSKSVQVIYTGLKQDIKKRLAEAKIVVRPLALETSIEEVAEQAKLKALEEGKDPYCKTGECG